MLRSMQTQVAEARAPPRLRESGPGRADWPRGPAVRPREPPLAGAGAGRGHAGKRQVHDRAVARRRDRAPGPPGAMGVRGRGAAPGGRSPAGPPARLEGDPRPPLSPAGRASPPPCGPGRPPSWSTAPFFRRPWRRCCAATWTVRSSARSWRASPTSSARSIPPSSTSPRPTRSPPSAPSATRAAWRGRSSAHRRLRRARRGRGRAARSGMGGVLAYWREHAALCDAAAAGAGLRTLTVGPEVGDWPSRRRHIAAFLGLTARRARSRRRRSRGSRELPARAGSQARLSIHDGGLAVDGLLAPQPARAPRAEPLRASPGRSGSPSRPTRAARVTRFHLEGPTSRTPGSPASTSGWRELVLASAHGLGAKDRLQILGRGRCRAPT